MIRRSRHRDAPRRHESFFVDLYDNSQCSLFTKRRGLATILNDD